MWLSNCQVQKYNYKKMYQHPVFFLTNATHNLVYLKVRIKAKSTLMMEIITLLSWCQRQISNLCSSSKIFEKLILKGILEIQDENIIDLTGPNQHGLQKGIALQVFL